MPDYYVDAAPSRKELLKIVEEMREHYPENCARITGENIEVQLLMSKVPRRGTNVLDIDLVGITVCPERKGIGTEFFHALLDVAERVGRGVYIECASTVASRAWVRKLQKEELVFPYKQGDYTVPDCWLSTKGSDLVKSGLDGSVL